MNRIKITGWNAKRSRKSDEVYELHKRVLARQGFALYEIIGCPEPNYECIQRR